MNDLQPPVRANSLDSSLRPDPGRKAKIAASRAGGGPLARLRPQALAYLGIAMLTPIRYSMYEGWIVTAPSPSCCGTPYCLRNRTPPSTPQRPKLRFAPVP